MKIIFLDLDGVLNSNEFYKRVSVSKRMQSRLEIGDEWGEMFCPRSSELLNELITRTSAKVVISSTKRITKEIKNGYDANLKCIQDMWKNRGFVGEVIGITPHFGVETERYAHVNQFPKYGCSIARGQEINEYLKVNHNFSNVFYSEGLQEEWMGKSDIENYIILDDDGDMLYHQRNHFVHVLPPPRNYSGFNKRFFNQVLSKLSKNVIELNYNLSRKRRLI